MAQYSYYTKEIPKYWVDPVTLLRFENLIRSDYFYGDCELTATGFGGTEDVDWKTVESFGTAVTGLRAREGVRNAQYFIDIELTATGFAGTEGVDWTTIDGGY